VSDSVNVSLLAQKVRQLESQMSRTAVANVDDQTVAGAITVRWNAAPAADLSHYNVEVSESSGFTGSTTYRTTGTRFEYTDGVQGTTYFIRVSTINKDGTASDPTPTLNSTTGQVGTAALEVGAASSVSRFAKSTGFTKMVAVDVPGDTQVFGPVFVEVARDDSVVLPLVVTEVDLHSNWTGVSYQYVLMELLRRRSGESNDTVIDSVQPDFKSDLPGVALPATARVVLAAFTTFDTPGAGDVEYRVRLTAVKGDPLADLELTVNNITVEMVQLK
jgi:hypothetical protein